jgi:two-component system nitrate/nitrite response regulator NarL
VVTRVVIADGIGVFRAAVRHVLEREPDFAVREAATLADLQASLAAGVDVALIDADLPPSGAIAAVELASGACAEIVVWSLDPVREHVVDAVVAGATGYLSKDIAPDALVRALRCASRGEAPMPPALVAMLVRGLHGLERRHRAREHAAVLSSREREVLDHVVRGARNKQIASALTISEFTVKRHVQNILQKLDVATRGEAAALYATYGEPLREAVR